MNFRNWHEFLFANIARRQHIFGSGIISREEREGGERKRFFHSVFFASFARHAKIFQTMQLPAFLPPPCQPSFFSSAIAGA
jgi:hypothetical protein